MCSWISVAPSLLLSTGPQTVLTCAIVAPLPWRLFLSLSHCSGGLERPADGGHQHCVDFLLPGTLLSHHRHFYRWNWEPTLRIRRPVEPQVSNRVCVVTEARVLRISGF